MLADSSSIVSLDTIVKPVNLCCDLIDTLSILYEE